MDENHGFGGCEVQQNINLPSIYTGALLSVPKRRSRRHQPPKREALLPRAMRRSVGKEISDRSRPNRRPVTDRIRSASWNKGAKDGGTKMINIADKWSFKPRFTNIGPISCRKWLPAEGWESSGKMTERLHPYCLRIFYWLEKCITKIARRLRIYKYMSAPNLNEWVSSSSITSSEEPLNENHNVNCFLFKFMLIFNQPEFKRNTTFLRLRFKHDISKTPILTNDKQRSPRTGPTWYGNRVHQRIIALAALLRQFFHTFRRNHEVFHFAKIANLQDQQAYAVISEATVQLKTARRNATNI